MIYADYLLINGNIYTMDNRKRRAKQIAIKDGKIIAFDQEADLVSNENTKIIDVDGHTVLPGFIESHAHPLQFARNLYHLDLRPEYAKSVKDILQAVKEHTKKVKKDDWILGFGWDDTKLHENRFPTIEELTEVAPENPVFLKRTCVHNAVVNKKAMEVSGLNENSEDPPGGHFHRDPNTNKLSGLIQENAMNLFDVPSFSLEDQIEAMLSAQRQFFKWGITTIHDMAVTKDEMKVYQQLYKDSSLKLKLRLWLWGLDQMGWQGVQEDVFNLGIESGLGNDRLNIQGIKYMLDGSVGGRTASLAQPYEGENTNHGILYMEQDEIKEYVKSSIKNNLRVSIHGIGEKAIDMALKAIINAASPQKNKKMRHRIEHCALPTEKHLKQLVNHNIIACSSIGFIYSIGDSYIKNLGRKRCQYVFPHASFKKHGIRAPGNSDLPVCNGNPFYGIYAATTRQTISGQQMGTKEIVPREDAIKAYTTEASYAGFDEKSIGSLSIGKYADMIILNKDPFAVDLQDLKKIEVIQTIIEGNIVYKK